MLKFNAIYNAVRSLNRTIKFKFENFNVYSLANTDISSNFTKEPGAKLQHDSCIVIHTCEKMRLFQHEIFL